MNVFMQKNMHTVLKRKNQKYIFCIFLAIPISHSNKNIQEKWCTLNIENVNKAQQKHLFYRCRPLFQGKKSEPSCKLNSQFFISWEQNKEHPQKFSIQLLFWVPPAFLVHYLFHDHLFFRRNLGERRECEKNLWCLPAAPTLIKIRLLKNYNKMIIALRS